VLASLRPIPQGVFLVTMASKGLITRGCGRRSMQGSPYFDILCLLCRSLILKGFQAFFAGSITDRPAASLITGPARRSAPVSQFVMRTVLGAARRTPACRSRGDHMTACWAGSSDPAPSGCQVCAPRRPASGFPPVAPVVACKSPSAVVPIS